MHFVYHPNHEAKIVSTEEYQQYLDAGWYDTPANFPAKVAEKAKSEIKVSEDLPLDEPNEVSEPKKKGRPRKDKVEAARDSVEL